MSTGSSPSVSVELIVPRKGWILPEKMRGQLSMPFGSLMDEKTALREAQGVEGLVTVGDVVTLCMLDNGVRPRLLIFDLVNERKEMPLLGERLAEVEGVTVKVKNPAGHITPDMVKQVKRALRSEKRTKLQVVGEEDLAALVCAAYAPDGTRLMYGLPRKGIVLIEVDQQVRDKARVLIKAMEECN